MRRGMKQWISGMVAAVLALQPTMSVMAQTEEQTTIRGEDYTIRSNFDGSKTLTFSAQLEADGSGTPDVASDSEEEAPALETHIQGSGEDTQVTMEYGD